MKIFKNNEYSLYYLIQHRMILFWDRLLLDAEKNTEYLRLTVRRYDKVLSSIIYVSSRV